jgi:GNAT superfamily N-acetyltransferase
VKIEKAAGEDLKEILALQYLAYQSEAELLGDPNIPPLKQSLPEVEAEYKRGVILKAVEADSRIIGSVRGYVENGTLYIGKLIVQPDRQGESIGSALLSEIERVCPAERCELFTSEKSAGNLHFY